MNNPLKLYIQGMRRAKKKRRQFACVATALSVLVSGSVFWQLRGIGTAMVDVNLPAADDSGGDIGVTQLSCSELETPDVWEATLPPLTDIAGENVARIAESQVGYTESSVNFVHAEDGETHNGYTRYGAWYGNPYGEWNTMFTYFCMDYAGISNEDVPYGSGCWAWSLELENAGLITPVTRGSPQRGDILLLDCDTDGKVDRSCIVSSADEDELIVIEGDTDGCVAKCVYSATDERFIGMVSLEGMTAEPPILPDVPAQLDFTAESESGIRVEAHADWGAFPFDTVMSVFDISRDEAIQTAADRLGKDAENVDAVAVDITFTAPDGSELEPAEDSQVSVSIALPDEQALSDGEFSLLHVTDDGDVHEVEDADVSADGATFKTESFSLYIVTSNGTLEKRSVIMANGVRGNNSADNRFIIGKGETVVFRYEGIYATSEHNGIMTVFDNNPTSTTHNINPQNSLDSSGDGFIERHFIADVPGDCRLAMLKTNTWSDAEDNIAEILYITVVDNPVYMYADGDRLILDTALRYLNKTTNRDIYLLEGETCTFSLNGTGQGSNFSVSDASYISMGTPTNNGSNTDVTFTALKHGTPTITINGTTINVHIVHPMYVKTSTGERDIDRINEWLSVQSWYNKINGYHPNNDEPYLLYDGDTISLHIPTGDLSGATLTLPDDGSLTIKSGSVSPVDGNIIIELTAHNTTDNPINTTVKLEGSSSYKRTMKIRILPQQNDLLDHADIEIADGGKYTVTKLKRNIDGSYTKTVVEYRAYVSGVNSSTLYEDATTPCTMHSTYDYWANRNDPNDTTQYTYYQTEERELNGVKDRYIKDTGTRVTRANTSSPWKDSGEEEYDDDEVEKTSDTTGYVGGTVTDQKTGVEDYPSTVTGYRSDQYHVDPGITPGAPQYEFTSKYNMRYNSSGNIEYYDWSNTKYYASEVDHVVFDVKVSLEPLSQTEYTLVGTEWVAGTTVPITSQPPKKLDSVLFSMDHQAVLDAYNKCPNHTGLDFTIMAFSALVEFDLNKDLTGDSSIQANQFEFEVVDGSNNVVSTARNDASGIVTFDSLHFEDVGTYTYTIREKAGSDSTIIYDNSIIALEIEVTRDASNRLVADIKSDTNTFNFTNHKAYTLPSTGGTGDLPYIIFGSAMISGALLLLYRRRKKEVAQ